MFQKTLIAMLTAGSIALLSPADAQAWGAAHVGYTHVGPAGVSHYGGTAARGPYGAYSGAHAGAYGYGGASYHAGYGTGYAVGGAGAYHYNTGYASPYHYGTMPYGGTGYAGGVYRRY